MPTFAVGSGVGDTYATILFTYPATDWFKWAILGALSEMIQPDNWTELGDVDTSFAVEESEKMLEGYKVMNFNPFPVGMIVPFGSATIPDGYLLADGSTQSATIYPELFAAIGYTFGGAGDDFNLPSLINRSIIGASDLYTVGDTGGEAEVFLDVASLPAHTHIDSGHAHSIPLVTSLPAQAGVGFAGNVTVPVITDLTGFSAANNQNTGGDGAHNNLQPYQAITYLIYAGR